MGRTSAGNRNVRRRSVTRSQRLVGREGHLPECWRNPQDQTLPVDALKPTGDDGVQRARISGRGVSSSCPPRHRRSCSRLVTMVSSCGRRSRALTVPHSTAADLHPAQAGSALMTPAERLAVLVRDSSPFAQCFTCLAAKLHLSEHDVRAEAVPIVVRRDCQLVRRVCDFCGRMSEGLAFGGPRSDG